MGKQSMSSTVRPPLPTSDTWPKPVGYTGIFTGDGHLFGKVIPWESNKSQPMFTVGGWTKATYYGAAAGLFVTFFQNGLMKRPLMRCPWEHPIFMVAGAHAANYYVDLTKYYEKKVGFKIEKRAENQVLWEAQKKG